jgi:hypothetical protein
MSSKVRKMNEKLRKIHTQSIPRPHYIKHYTKEEVKPVTKMDKKGGAPPEKKTVLELLEEDDEFEV